MNRKTNLITEWLSNEGYKHTVDEDGDVIFKYQGANLVCPAESNDPLFFRILMPGIYEIEGNREKCLEAMNTVCRERKVVKAFSVENTIHLSIEMLMDSSPEIEDFFERCCDMLIEAQQVFYHNIHN
jgi:hypothetical protein